MGIKQFGQKVGRVSRQVGKKASGISKTVGKKAGESIVKGTEKGLTEHVAMKAKEGFGKLSSRVRGNNPTPSI